MAVGLALPETRLVLDNDIFTHWRSQQAYVLKPIAEYQSSIKYLPSLTSITVFETLSGFEKISFKLRGRSESAKRSRIRAEQLIGNCIVLPFDQNAAAIAAYIFPRLSQSDRNKHWRDMFIAATALAHGHGVATGNRRDFELIANLLPGSQILRLAV